MPPGTLTIAHIAAAWDELRRSILRDDLLFLLRMRWAQKCIDDGWTYYQIIVPSCMLLPGEKAEVLHLVMSPDRSQVVEVPWS